MDQLRTVVEELVGAGIRSYIGLLGLGEQVRSRRLFSDALELSAIVAGGPSARVKPMRGALIRGEGVSYDSSGGPLMSCLVLLTVRSMLSTLLVLKTTVYWRKLPQLDELLQRCLRAAACVEDREREAVVAEGGVAGPDPEDSSANTAGLLNGASTNVPGSICGCRRNSALPTRPELSYQPAGNEE